MMDVRMDVDVDVDVVVVVLLLMQRLGWSTFPLISSGKKSKFLKMARLFF